jgi:rSAM/selenodomain-associated transferase 1
MRAPLLGQVKTRLAVGLGAEVTLAAYRHLLDVTTKAVRGFDSVEFRYTPDDASSTVEPWRRKGWSTAAQGAGDLGERLVRAFSDGFASGFDRIVVVGTDCPYVTDEDIRRAWEALKTHDVVLGPATDGGYWLIGLRSPQPGFFSGMNWGGETVFAETRRRVVELGLTVSVLRELPDVDTVADWEAYQAFRASNPTTSPLFASGPAPDNLGFR